jgi:hypothetical protein
MRRYYFTLVTSSRHVVVSSHANLEDDRQAEDWARETLGGASPLFVIIEAWERARLVCRLERRSSSISSSTSPASSGR